MSPWIPFFSKIFVSSNLCMIVFQLSSNKVESRFSECCYDSKIMLYFSQENEWTNAVEYYHICMENPMALMFHSSQPWLCLVWLQMSIQCSVFLIIVHIFWVTKSKLFLWIFLKLDAIYCQTSNISRTSVGNKIADHPDVVGPSPVSAAPNTSSSLFNTWL